MTTIHIGDRVIVTTSEPYFNLSNPRQTVPAEAALGEEFIVTMVWADGDLQVRDLADTRDAVLAPACVAVLEAVELVEPLAAPLESVDNFADMWITGKFNDLIATATTTDGEDFSDLVRAIPMSLAINDPERPAAPVAVVDEDDEDDPRAIPLAPLEKADGSDANDIITARDADGDFLKMAYNRRRGVLYIHTSPSGHYLPMASIAELIEWLQSRKAKHEGDGADAGGVAP